MLKKTCLIIILATNFSDLLSTDRSAPRSRRVVCRRPFYYELEGKQDGDIPNDTSIRSLGTPEKRMATMERAHQIINSVSREAGYLAIFAGTRQDHGELTIDLTLDNKKDRITRSMIIGPGFQLSFDMTTDPTYSPSDNCQTLMERLISRNQLSYYTCVVHSSDGSPNIGLLMLLTSAHGTPIPCRSSQDLTLNIPHAIQAELRNAHEECVQAQLRREERWSPLKAAFLGAAFRAKPIASAPPFDGVHGTAAVRSTLPKPINCHCTLM